VHLHLIDCWIVSRKEGRAEQANKQNARADMNPGRGVFPYETGSKDVIFLGPNEEVTIAFIAEPNRGNFMYHCHNLIHEDDDMLLAFQVLKVTIGQDPTPNDPPFPQGTSLDGERIVRWQDQVSPNNPLFEYLKLDEVQDPFSPDTPETMREIFASGSFRSGTFVEGDGAKDTLGNALGAVLYPQAAVTSNDVQLDAS